MDVRVGLWRRLSAKELMLLHCGVGEDSWESLGLQGDPTSPFWRRLEFPFWNFFGRNDVEAETPVLWPPHVKSWLIGKDSDAGRDWGQEQKGTTEDEMAGWHHWLDGHESEWTPGAGDGQGDLACCNSWGHKESDMTEWLNWTEGNISCKDGQNKGQKWYGPNRAEDIKKRWQEYTEKLYKKDLHNPDNHNGVITHLESDILECEVKWALGSITMNKASGGDGIPVELFQI